MAKIGYAVPTKQKSPYPIQRPPKTPFDPNRVIGKLIIFGKLKAQRFADGRVEHYNDDGTIERIHNPIGVKHG
jgi:hypothetical protein